MSPYTALALVILYSCAVPVAGIAWRREWEREQLIKLGRSEEPPSYAQAAFMLVVMLMFAPLFAVVALVNWHAARRYVSVSAVADAAEVDRREIAKTKRLHHEDQHGEPEQHHERHDDRRGHAGPLGEQLHQP